MTGCGCISRAADGAGTVLLPAGRCVLRVAGPGTEVLPEQRHPTAQAVPTLPRTESSRRRRASAVPPLRGGALVGPALTSEQGGRLPHKVHPHEPGSATPRAGTRTACVARVGCGRASGVSWLSPARPARAHPRTESSRRRRASAGPLPRSGALVGPAPTTEQKGRLPHKAHPHRPGSATPRAGACTACVARIDRASGAGPSPVVSPVSLDGHAICPARSQCASRTEPDTRRTSTIHAGPSAHPTRRRSTVHPNPHPTRGARP